jgi:hypothetical protein
MHSQQTPVFQQMGRQLLVNGDFATYTTSPGIPDSWTGNNATAAKDTTNFETGSWGVNVGTTASGTSRIEQTLPAGVVRQFRGKWLTLAARILVAAGQPSPAGVVQIADGVTSPNSSSTPIGQGNFIWVMVSGRIDAAAGTIVARVYASFGSIVAAATIDRVILTPGRWPRDM